MSVIPDPDTILNDGDGCNAEVLGRVSRPTLSQVKAVISFMEKHPDLAQRKLGKGRVGVGHEKFKKLWLELTNIVNSIDGVRKSTKGWVKFWSDKRRSIDIKKKQIEQGKVQGSLTALERRILDLCAEKCTAATRKKQVKEEPCNGDDNDSFDDVLSNGYSQAENLFTEVDDRQLNMIDKLVVVMDQQSAAMAQMAEANLSSSRALERIAEASHLQALAVDRLTNTFDTISASFHDVRNAILGIDYTMKRLYPAAGTQQRENPNIFS